MKIVSSIVGTLLLSLVACEPFPPRHPPTWAQPRSDEAMTTRGVVLSIEEPPPEDVRNLVHVVIAPADAQPIRLVLAPGWYLAEKGIRFEPQQTVQVSGKRVVGNGQPSIVVQNLEQGGHNYILRDEHEKPVWPEP